MALPGGRGRGSATCPAVRTKRTRAGAGQMAVCVRGHITANQNQFFESIARGVMRGWDMWLGARSVPELSYSFGLTKPARVRGLRFLHLQEVLGRPPTRWRSNLFMYFVATCPGIARQSVWIITERSMPCALSCMCATSPSMINACVRTWQPSAQQCANIAKQASSSERGAGAAWHGGVAHPSNDGRGIWARRHRTGGHERGFQPRGAPGWSRHRGVFLGVER